MCTLTGGTGHAHTMKGVVVYHRCTLTGGTGHAHTMKGVVVYVYTHRWYRACTHNEGSGSVCVHSQVVQGMHTQ